MEGSERVVRMQPESTMSASFGGRIVCKRGEHSSSRADFANAQCIPIIQRSSTKLKSEPDASRKEMQRPRWSHPSHRGLERAHHRCHHRAFVLRDCTHRPHGSRRRPKSGYPGIPKRIRKYHWESAAPRWWHQSSRWLGRSSVSRRTLRSAVGGPNRASCHAVPLPGGRARSDRQECT